MTNHEIFESCWDAARKIVEVYRSEAPEGCDPQNSGVALATLVIGAGTAAYSSYSQKQAAAKAQAAGGSSKFTPIVLPDAPKFIPVDYNSLENTAVGADRTGYQLSEQDFRKHHKPIIGAEKLFEAQTLKDQQGDSELLPAIQNEYMRAGIGGALDSFGNTPGTLAPGSAGEAAVARNLGVSIAGFQDRNRSNREKSLMLAEQIFPRRTFGLSGADAAAVETANVAGQNNWNQADYANQIQALQFNATGGANFANAQQNQANFNAQASATSDAERNKAIINATTLAAQLYQQNKGRQAVATSAAARPNATSATTGQDISILARAA